MFVRKYIEKFDWEKLYICFSTHNGPPWMITIISQGLQFPEYITDYKYGHHGLQLPTQQTGTFISQEYNYGSVRPKDDHNYGHPQVMPLTLEVMPLTLEAGLAHALTFNAPVFRATRIVMVILLSHRSIVIFIT